VIAKSR